MGQLVEAGASIGVEGGGVVGVPRVAGGQPVRQRTVGIRGELVDGPHQLGDRHAGWYGLVAAFLLTGPRDDQVVAGGGHRVQEQLPVLGPGVVVTDTGVAGDQVVDVRPGGAGEHPVVHAEQADHAVGHRPHRHERADGQVAGHVVGAAGPATQPVGQQVADLVEGHVRRQPVGAVGQLAEQAGQLGSLPRLVPGRQAELVDDHPEQVDPGIDGTGGAQLRQQGRQPVADLGQAADGTHSGALDVVVGGDPVEGPVALVGHGHAEQQPVESLVEGVVAHAVQAEP